MRDRPPEEDRETVLDGLEREVLLYLLLHLKNKGVIVDKVYENAVELVLRQYGRA